MLMEAPQLGGGWLRLERILQRLRQVGEEIQAGGLFYGADRDQKIIQALVAVHSLWHPKRHRLPRAGIIHAPQPDAEKRARHRAFSGAMDRADQNPEPAEARRQPIDLDFLQALPQQLVQALALRRNVAEIKAVDLRLAAMQLGHGVIGRQVAAIVLALAINRVRRGMLDAWIGLELWPRQVAIIQHRRDPISDPGRAAAAAI